MAITLAGIVEPSLAEAEMGQADLCLCLQLDLNETHRNDYVVLSSTLISFPVWIDHGL
jgi:hypothetical protein